MQTENFSTYYSSLDHDFPASVTVHQWSYDVALICAPVGVGIGIEVVLSE